MAFSEILPRYLEVMLTLYHKCIKYIKPRLRCPFSSSLRFPLSHIVHEPIVVINKARMDHSHMDHGDGGMDMGSRCQMNVSLIRDRDYVFTVPMDNRCSSHGIPATSASSSPGGTSTRRPPSSSPSSASSCSQLATRWYETPADAMNRRVQST